MLLIYVVVVVIYLHLFEWWSTIPWLCLFFFIIIKRNFKNKIWVNFLGIILFRSMMMKILLFPEVSCGYDLILLVKKFNSNIVALRGQQLLDIWNKFDNYHLWMHSFHKQTINQFWSPWRSWPQISKSRKLIDKNKFHIMKILNWNFGLFIHFCSDTYNVFWKLNNKYY